MYKKNLLFLLALLICGFSSINMVKAQVSAYTFAQSTGTYTPITGGTVYGNTASDDQRFVDPAAPLGSETVLSGVGIPIGFNFTYNGQVYDRIAINFNGWISFGNSSLTPAVNMQSSSNYTALAGTSTATPAHLRNRVAGINLDYESNASSELRVQTIGTAPNQVCVIQWKNVQEYTFPTDNINFQIRLVQSNNSVQVVFGTNARPDDGTYDASIGLGGTTNTDFNNRLGTDFTTTTAGALNTDRVYFYSASLPVPGLTYTWVAASCAPPSSVQFSSVTLPTANISWTAATGAASYQYAITTSSTPPATGTTTTTTTGTASGLPANTALFAHVRTNCGSEFSLWKTVAYLPCVTSIAPAAAATNVAIPTTFDWSPIAGATAYQILLSTDNGVTYPITGVFPTPPAANIGGLSYSTTYRWYVRAIFGADSSATTCAIANAKTFTTQVAPPPPANDSCGAPLSLISDVPRTGTNISATQSLATVACNNFTSPSPVYDVWYSITALFNGSATIALTGVTGGLDAVMVGYSGACGALTPIACADATEVNGNETLTLTGLVAGTTYKIRVYGYANTAGGTTGNFSILATGPALPVTGVVLSGLRNGNKTQLTWTTQTEINNVGFELQRSADGRSFTSIANIASKANNGNSTSAISYNVDDVKPFAGANYYRLKQNDKDGKINFSNTVYLKGTAVSNLTISSVYPNPTKDVLKASLQAPTAQNVVFVITDMVGKTVARQASNLVAGDNIVDVNVMNLPAGNYLLKVTCLNGCETTYQKFSKQ